SGASTTGCCRAAGAAGKCGSAVDAAGGRSQECSGISGRTNSACSCGDSVAQEAAMSDTTRLYVSRPRQVEAIQWTGDVRAIDRSPFGGVVAWACDDEREDLLLLAGKDGAQGWVPVPLGHWLVRNAGDPSDNWPVDPDHFAATYDRGGDE